MLETTNILVNKLSMPITLSDESMGDLETCSIVIEILYRQICNLFETTLDWRSFSKGGSYTSTDNTIRGISAYSPSEYGVQLWASSLYVKDKQFPRRRWKYYFGIKQSSNTDVILSYAKCRYDHMAGSITQARPVAYSRDTLPDPLFYDPRVICMIGNHPYSTDAVNLNSSTLHGLIDLIQDEDRGIPVMLITCPDVIAPQMIAEMTLGNLSVYWCDDSKTVMQLNASLPQDIHTPWDTVRFFMPINSGTVFHPCYAYEEIRRMGVNDFIAGVHRAYCENMHSAERRSFLTVNEVLTIKDREYIRDLENTNREQLLRLAADEAKLKQQSHELALCRDRIAALTDPKKADEISELESMLSESMSETEILKKSITALSSALYSTMGIGFVPDQTKSPAIIQELSHAIYSSLKCVQGRHKQ